MSAGDRVLQPLSSMQFRDANGNPISTEPHPPPSVSVAIFLVANIILADPDRSNPTRSRWERPLETIRSFEAAIDGGYDRKSILRGDGDSVAFGNRRSSYYANNSK